MSSLKNQIMPWMHTAIPCAVSCASTAGTWDSHHVLEKLLPRLAGWCPHSVSATGPLTVDNDDSDDDDDKLKWKVLEQEKLLPSHVLVQIYSSGGPEHPGPRLVSLVYLKTAYNICLVGKRLLWSLPTRLHSSHGEKTGRDGAERRELKGSERCFSS